jgi:hypothetical protein
MGKVFASDWNPLQSTIAGVMGTATDLSKGWGKASSITSSQVNSSLQINHTHYNALKTDIDYCYTHITGSASALPTRNAGTQITQADLTNISAAATYINTYKTYAAASQLTTSNMFSNTQAYTWTATLGATYTFSWASVAEFNGFWNAGGQVYWNVSRYAGATNSQNQSWTNLLSNAGFFYINATASGQSGNTWTGTVNNTSGISGFSVIPVTFIQVYDQDTNYTSNYYRASVWLDNTPGSAKTMNIQILLVDAHTPVGAGPDTIDGNFAVTITQKYPYTYAAGAATSSNGILT